MSLQKLLILHFYDRTSKLRLHLFQAEIKHCLMSGKMNTRIATWKSGLLVAGHFSKGPARAARFGRGLTTTSDRCVKTVSIRSHRTLNTPPVQTRVGFSCSAQLRPLANKTIRSRFSKCNKGGSWEPVDETWEQSCSLRLLPEVTRAIREEELKMQSLTHSAATDPVLTVLLNSFFREWYVTVTIVWKTVINWHIYSTSATRECSFLALEEAFSCPVSLHSSVNHLYLLQWRACSVQLLCLMTFSQPPGNSFSAGKFTVRHSSQRRTAPLLGQLD